ncbi:MAG: beta-ketoacyl-ACP synthase II [Lachnospiraceae bacterium]|jgi:3-oxoacyl-[acyl-carrier-protein] synthase II|nr:beta-ketoacyl-ACP synthase II [Lachnospiraceae bacterium]MEE3460971.1 beta-ketoacyl-ACP synthase II [Lachnospiraceae bacterium]
METRRVVITGLGTVNPTGNTVEESWNNVKNGINGLGPITKFDAGRLKVKVVGEVKNFDPSLYMDFKEIKRSDLFSMLAVAAAAQAVEDSGIKAEDEDPYRVGVIVSSGIGGFTTIESEIGKLYEKGPRRVSPFFIPMIIANMASADIAMRYGFRGTNKDIVSACASGTHSIGDAYRDIKFGYSDVMLAGGCEGSICESALAGFQNLTALSLSEDPDEACRPFDKNRSGFVMSDGAGVMVLEELEHARKRGAKIYGEIAGYGETDDAHHMTAPLEDGSAAARAMQNAIDEAGIRPEEVGYINAHGTGTHANDAGETRAIKTVFGDYAKNIPVSSTKSETGHMLGAAGAVEAIFSTLAIREGFIPPTINLTTPDPECDLDYVPGKGRKADINYAISNSFGFGGHNAVICIKKYTD